MPSFAKDGLKELELVTLIQNPRSQDVDVERVKWNEGQPLYGARLV